MRKKRRPSRVSYDGAIKQIYDYFIGPFTRHLYIRPDQSDFEVGLRHFFNSETRDVSVYRVHTAFTMPGGRQVQGHANLIRGEGRRAARPTQTMIVRTDDNMYDRIDVEFDEQVFQLSHPEWATIREKLQRIT